MDNEQKWIRQIQRRGSREAADCLIRAYYDEIYRFAYRQTGNKEDASAAADPGRTDGGAGSGGAGTLSEPDSLAFGGQDRHLVHAYCV